MSDALCGPSTAMAARACGAATRGRLPAAVDRHLHRHAARIAPGEAFFAIKGDDRDGHDFVDAALEGRRGLAVVARERARAPCRRCAAARRRRRARRLARRSRARRARGLHAQGRRASPARSARPAPRRRCASRSSRRRRDARLGRLLQQSLGRAADAGAHARETRDYGVFEIGMNHAGEITPLTQLVRPHVAIITTVEPVHLEYFGSLEAIADAKAEIFLGLEPGGAAVLNRDNRSVRAAATPRAEAAGVDASSPSASTPRPTRACCACSLQPDLLDRRGAHPRRSRSTYRLGAPGRHIVHEFARRAGGGVARRRRPRARRAGARRPRSRRPAAARASRSSVPGGESC